MEINAITHEIIGSSIKVHSYFGPGMLESAYEKCLVYELAKRGLAIERQIVLPLIYDGITIDAGYRLDLRVSDLVIVEIKAVDIVLPVHKAQLLCYMRLSGCRVGLIINFNVVRLVDGITRMILD
jgi:GxxExxY protein